MPQEKPQLVPLAREMAISMHESCGHRRSDGSPYWQHPERVVETLARFGLPEEVLAAAWLHDVPEDCPTDIAGCEKLLLEIEAKFGPEVGHLVREVTNFFGPEATMEEKQARLREHARHMSSAAKFIKLADRFDNISGMVGWPKPKRDRYTRATELLIEALRPIPPGAETLVDAILDRVAHLRLS